MPATEREMLDQCRSEKDVACMVLALIRDQANKLQAGPESSCPITPENGEKLRAGLIKIAGQAHVAIVALHYHP